MHPDLYHCRSYETIFYARKGIRPLVKAGLSNVLAYPAIHLPQKLHLTEKPIALLTELISRTSYEGEVVLDPCAGSGSTLVAARDLKRDYMGIEIDEHYFNVCANRLSLKEAQ